MIDPFTIVATTAAIADLAKLATEIPSTIAKLAELRKAWTELPEVLTNLSEQLPLLLDVLNDCERSIKQKKVLDRDTGCALSAVIKSCRQNIRKLDNLISPLILAPADGSMKKGWEKAKSFLEESEIFKIENKIDVHMNRIMFYCTWSASDLNPNNNKLFHKFTKWLAPADQAHSLRKAADQRSPGTGLRFLQGEKYQEWKSTKSSRMWLHGSAGAGKTILASAIVQDLRGNDTADIDPARAVAYFFFDFNNRSKHYTIDMLTAITTQLLYRMIPDKAQDLFAQCNKGTEQPSEEQLLRLCQLLTAKVPVTYLLLDALDECKNRQNLLASLQEMLRWTTPRLHIMFTSRKEREIYDCVSDHLPSSNIMSLKKVEMDKDIQRYILERLRTDNRLRRWHNDAEAQGEIVSVLSTKARGMFRWAACQLDAITKCLNRKMLRQALQELPEDLDETYVRILKSIERKHVDYALAILRWLVFAAKPLLISEVLQVTGFQLDANPIFDNDGVLMDMADIERICSSLIIIDSKKPEQPFRAEIHVGRNASGESEQSLQSSHPDSDVRIKHTLGTHCRVEFPPTVRLAHFSVQEFLLSDRIAQGPASQFKLTYLQSHNIIARSCIEYLFHLGAFREDNAWLFDQFPLAKYAGYHWTTHVRAIEDAIGKENDHNNDGLSPELMAVIDQFGCKPSPAFEWWQEISTDSMICKAWQYGFSHPNRTPLHAACQEGLISAVRSILRSSTKNVEQTWDRHGANLDKGCINDEQKFGSPLVAVCFYGDAKLVDFLLSRGANLNGIQDSNWLTNPLQAAAANGRHEIVARLLYHGAAVDPWGWKEETPLMAAAGSHKPDAIITARHLLNKGAWVNAKSVQYGAVIQIAARSQNRELVKMLIEEFGADVNAQGGECCENGTALYSARPQYHVDMMRYLFDKGAVDTGNAALRAACKSGRGNIARILIDHCGDINAAPALEHDSNASSTILREAALGKNVHIVEMLLKAGATDTNNEILDQLSIEYDRAETSGSSDDMAELSQVYNALKRADAGRGESRTNG